MKINGKKVTVIPLEIEEIEGEIVAYNISDRKIIAFNKTASLIWHIVTELSNTESNITSEQISEKLIGIFHMMEVDKEQICNDVNYILNTFIDKKMICKVEVSQPKEGHI